VNIEGLCFQGVVQAGRHMLLDIAFLTGTNYVIKKDILLEVGGWDEEALAEDSELSTRLYMERYRVDYVPCSQTWEQEPETLKVWMTQRTRWARGNNYAILKLIRHFGSSKDKARTFENLFMLTMSYSFLIALVISQVALMLSLFGFEHLNHDSGWIFCFWQFSALFYFAQIWFTLSLEREAKPESLLVGFLMYFFYGYLWMGAIMRALYYDVIVRKARNWDKTVRFETELEVGQN
jgi:cellulose synthase/poly-beta-1,6-N-acetylglucosamine synthase-like glycosyltransferase